jgi:hypothetical protein
MTLNPECEFSRAVFSKKMRLTSGGMAFSEETNIEAISKKEIGFREIFISYSQRVG